MGRQEACLAQGPCGAALTKRGWPPGTSQHLKAEAAGAGLRVAELRPQHKPKDAYFLLLHHVTRCSWSCRGPSGSEGPSLREPQGWGPFNLLHRVSTWTGSRGRPLPVRVGAGHRAGNRPALQPRSWARSGPLSSGFFIYKTEVRATPPARSQQEVLCRRVEL